MGLVNKFFHQKDYELFEQSVEELKSFPFDAFIVSDLGPARLLRKTFGDSVRLHLSTQANTLNSGAIEAYRELGFSRIILGREVSLDDIRRIRDRCPDVELETFVHGAMCMAYSGRCFSQCPPFRPQRKRRRLCAHLQMDVQTICENEGRLRICT